MLKRRTFLQGALSGGALALSRGFASAQSSETVKIALIAPQTGPWATGGIDMLNGAQLAIEDINAAGGIKALNGAKMELIVFDTGDNVEKAKNAAQRLVAESGGISGLTGCWLSSFTMAVSEVTERAELPMLTLSFADAITDRGFKYIFQTSATGVKMAEAVLPALLQIGEKSGARPARLGVLGDNTAASKSFAQPMRDRIIPELKLETLFDETFTPPLSDATVLVQKVRADKPDLLLLLTTNVGDDKLLLEKLIEFGMGAATLPVVANGSHMVAPDLLKNAGADILQGAMTIVANWGAKGQEEIATRYTATSGDPWITQEAISTYGDMWLFKEAIEKAGSAQPNAIAEALRTIDLTDGAARFFPGGRVRFDEKGRRIDASMIIVQWQDGKPLAIYPESSAAAAPIWPVK